MRNLKKDGYVVRITSKERGGANLCARYFLTVAGQEAAAAQFEGNQTLIPNKRLANTVYQQFIKELRQGRVDYLVPGAKKGFTAVKSNPSTFEVQAHEIRRYGQTVGRVAVVQNLRS